VEEIGEVLRWVLFQEGGCSIIYVMFVEARPQCDGYLFPGSGDELCHLQLKSRDPRALPTPAEFFVSPSIIWATGAPAVKDWTCAPNIGPSLIGINSKAVHEHS